MRMSAEPVPASVSMVTVPDVLLKRPRCVAMPWWRTSNCGKVWPGSIANDSGAACAAPHSGLHSKLNSRLNNGPDSSGEHFAMGVRRFIKLIFAYSPRNSACNPRL